MHLSVQTDQRSGVVTIQLFLHRIFDLTVLLSICLWRMNMYMLDVISSGFNSQQLPQFHLVMFYGLCCMFSN